MSKTSMSDYERLMQRYYALEEEIFGEEKRKAENKAKEDYRIAFSEFLRGKNIRDSLKSGSDGAGGYLVPDEFEKQLIEGLEEENILRKLAKKITCSYDLKMPGVASKGAAEWVEEEEIIPESSDTFNQVVIKAHKVATAIRVSDELLEDSGFDIEKYVIKEFSRRIGKAEEEAFLSGDGIGKPKGLLKDAELGVLTKSLNIDAAIDLFHSVGMRYRTNAIWLMSLDAFKILYKEKSGFGKNIWQPKVTKEEPELLLGKPVYICDSMPEIMSGSIPIAFGDISCFWVADRGKRSFKKLNELYALNGQVGFIASQRVDAKLVLPGAIKTLKLE